MHTIIHHIHNDNKLFITFSIKLLEIDLQSRYVEKLDLKKEMKQEA